MALNKSSLLSPPWIGDAVETLLTPSDQSMDDSRFGNSINTYHNRPKTVQVTAVYESINALRVSDSINYITVMLTTDCMNKYVK